MHTRPRTTGYALVMATSEHLTSAEPDGVSLHALLEKGPISADDQALLLGQIGDALIAAEGAGLGHPGLTTGHVFVTREEGEPFARVHGFEEVAREYRRSSDERAAWVQLATTIVGPHPPEGFSEWQARSLEVPLARSVADLRALFPLKGAAAGVSLGTSHPPTTFLRSRGRTDRAATKRWIAQRGNMLAFLLVPAAFGIAYRASRSRPSFSTVTTTSGSQIAPTPSAETFSTPSLDVLAADRAACPDRYVADPLLAAEQRAYRCVRAVLLPRLREPDAKPLNDPERRALKRACAALADLGCELRIEP